jgi:diguanylate cyclase (GGDEF)-like protein/PAS domain S-box-containing protein
VTRSRRPLADPATLLTFVERLKEGIYVSSASGAILDANPALLEILGVGSFEALAGLSATELFVDPERRREELALLAARGEVREFEIDLRRPDGDVRTVLDTCYTVVDPATGEPRYHGILVDITPRKELEGRLVEASRRDPLTGLHNRRFLAELIERLEERAPSWGAIVLDVDHFKQFNDRCGHQVGDEVLRRVAVFLTETVRHEDHVVRLGGDEFLVVVTRGGVERTPEIARRIESGACGGDLPIRLTLGWAARDGDERFEATLGRADRIVLARRDRERRT